MNPTTLIPRESIGISQRFAIPVVIERQQTFVDLDTAAEVDIVSFEFVQKHNFRPAKLTIPSLQAVGNLSVPTHGAFIIPITLKDSRGTEKKVKRPCITVERDPDLNGSPVLLSMTTLTELKIHLLPWKRTWWFENPKFELITARQLAKECRNQTHVFAIIANQIPEEVLDRNASEAKVRSNQGQSEVIPDDPQIPPEIRDYESVFSKADSKILPAHKSSEHSIDLIEGGEPPYRPIYPLSQNELKSLRDYLAENLENQRIRPSKSPAGAPILFVLKKDGSLRLCVDYRGLNKVSVKNRYPLPLISEILDRLSGSWYFSKIDVQDAYHRIRIKEGDEWKTAFRTRYGHFEYMVMPFGLTNAPATFQNYIHTALHGILDDFCIAYLDDILIFSKTRSEHTSHIK